MRPMILEIEGLHSFCGVQRIDFQALGETGLFGIFGPTGSGKSTVLDAVTFALYGRVRRVGGTQGIINTGLDFTRVKFVFELMKDGRRKTYWVERRYKRRKDSPYACEPKIARLVETVGESEVPLCDKAAKVTERVQELIGLSFEDYTRAVVLPQNSFQEFLMLKGKDRRAMLERVFYLEEYGKRLQEKLARKAGALKSSLDALNGELKGYEDATGEAVDEARKACAAAAAGRERLEKELGRATKLYNEAKTVWELVCELSRTEDDVRAHRAEEEATAEKRLWLDRAVKAEALAGPIRKNRDLIISLQEAGMGLHKAEGDLSQAEAELKNAREKYDALHKEAEAERPKLAEKRARLKNALEIRRQVLPLQEEADRQTASLGACERVIREKKAALEKGEAELEALEDSFLNLKRDMEPLKADPQYRQRIRAGAELEREVSEAKDAVSEQDRKKAGLEQTIAGLKRDLSAVRDDIEKARLAYEALQAQKRTHEAQKPEDREAVEQRLIKLHTIGAVYDTLIREKSEIDDLEAQIEKLRAKYRELEAQSSNRAQKRDEAEASLARRREEVQAAREALERNTAVLLSQKLVEGQPCPVCGSKYHPEPAALGEGPGAAALEERLRAAQKNANDAERAYQDAVRMAVAAAETLKARQERIDHSKEELGRKRAGYDVQKQKLPAGLRELEPDGIAAELSRMQKAGAKLRKAAASWEKTLEGIQIELKNANDVLAARRKDEAAIEAGLKVNEAYLSAQETELDAAKRALNEKQKAYAGFLLRHGVKSAAQESGRLDENERRLTEMQRRAGEIEDSAGQMREALKKLREELQEKKVARALIEADVKRLGEQKEERLQRIRELAGDADIEAQLGETDEKLAGYDADLEQLREGIRELEGRCSALEKERSLLLQKKEIYSQELECESKRLKAALLENGFDDANEAEAAVIDPQRLEGLRQEIEAYDSKEADLRASLEMIRKKLGGRSITEEEWALADGEYSRITDEKEEAFARHEVAKDALEKTEARHEKWLKLRAEKEGLDHRQDLFDQLKSLFRGNGFIDYIAEERLRYIALKATETLGVMTKHRYALELGDEAGFVIRDNANGGVQRPVTTLSGGEVFLASLSLALALSEHIQLKGQSPLELFFLDEGFGSLDPGLLDNVIDALERLVSKDRVIGLISHVPELRQRIGRRLIVDPPTLQGEGSTVRLERS